MDNNFLTALKTSLDNVYNRSVSENGAVGYKTTRSALLDCNFKISSYRKKEPLGIINDFMLAFLEEPILAMKWLFYVRDIRGGKHFA